MVTFSIPRVHTRSSSAREEEIDRDASPFPSSTSECPSSVHKSDLDGKDLERNDHANANPTQETSINEGPLSTLPSTDGPLKPWLGLRARLALSPISMTLLSLLFVGTRMLLSAGEVDDKIASAKANLLAKCHGAEGGASLAASLPHFTADHINQDAVRAVQSTVAGLGRTISLATTAIEEVLVWFADTYRSLFVCFIELLVRGTLSVLMSAVQLISSTVSATANGIRIAIQDSVSGVNDVISAAVGGINEVVGIFGKHITPPKIDPPSLDALGNVTLPAAIGDSLVSLNNSLPTLDDLKNRMDSLIRQPFSLLKTQINSTISDFHFNHSILPVPEMEHLTFCHKIETTPLDDLANKLKRIAYIGTGLIGLVILIMILLNAAIAWWSWKTMHQHVKRTRQAFLLENDTDGDTQTSDRATTENQASDIQEPIQTNRETPNLLSTPNLLMLLHLSEHPLVSVVALKLASALGIRSRQSRARLQWFLAFISHPAAVAALAAGLIGLLTIEFQELAIRKTQSEFANHLSHSFDAVADNLSTTVHAKVSTASESYANRTNLLILSAENQLNQHLLQWVDTTTTAMNNTLNQLVTGISEALNTTLGNTPFHQPLQTFLQCILGSKIAKIETALTWIHNNAQVEFSLVPQDVLIPNSQRIHNLVRPLQTLLIGNSDGSSPSVFESFLQSYLHRLDQERILFILLLLIYLLVFLIGLFVVLFHTPLDWLKKHSKSFPNPSTPTPTPAARPIISYPINMKSFITLKPTVAISSSLDLAYQLPPISTVCKPKSPGFFYPNLPTFSRSSHHFRSPSSSPSRTHHRSPSSPSRSSRSRPTHRSTSNSPSRTHHSTSSSPSRPYHRSTSSSPSRSSTSTSNSMILSSPRKKSPISLSQQQPLSPILEIETPPFTSPILESESFTNHQSDDDDQISSIPFPCKPSPPLPSSIPTIVIGHAL